MVKIRNGFTVWGLIAAITLVMGVSTTFAQPSPPQAPQVDLPPVVASVNSTNIDLQQLTEALQKGFGGPALKQAINRELVRQEASRLGVAVTQTEIDAYEDIALAGASPLRSSGRDGLSESAWRARMSYEALLDKLTSRLRHKLAATEAQAYFEANKSGYSAGPQIHIYEIVTTDIKDAYLAVERIKKGEEFSAVAGELSTENAKEKGDIGWMAPEDYHLTGLIKGMQPGEISPPFADNDKYYIVYIAEAADDRPAKFEDVKDEVIEEVAQADYLSFTADDYLELLARRANISVKYDQFKYMNAYYADLARIRVFVDGAEIELDKPVIRLESGSLIIPYKPVLQQLNATLTWNQGAQTLTIQTKQGKVVVTNASTIAIVGADPATQVTLPVPVQLRNGTLYGPPREVIEAVGGGVAFDGVSNTLTIYAPEETTAADDSASLQPEG